MSNKRRAIDGILLLDKPIGCSSNAALQRAKRFFRANKAGHTGSLDNLASGLLPVCFGEATKISGFLLNADKIYTTVCTLGITTTTGDAEGEVIETHPIEDLTPQKIETVIQSFIGEIQQVPPMYSALKHQGKPLYELARRGETVERQARTITIYAITVQAIGEETITLKVHCSKGTYIRTLVEEIGQALGCGAHVSALRRLQVGNYQEMFDFARLELASKHGLTELDSLLVPMDTALAHLPEVILTPEDAQAIQHGQFIAMDDVPESGLVRLATYVPQQTQFLGIGHILEDGRIAPKRLINSTS